MVSSSLNSKQQYSWQIRHKVKNVKMFIFYTVFFNSFMTEAVIIQKSVH